MRILLYLIDCEELRISVRARELYSIEKDALARSLWVSRHDEPRVVLFICNLLLDFAIFDDLALWENVLSSMLKSKQYQALPSVLCRLSTQPELIRMERLPEIWRSTLLGCFALVSETTAEGRVTVYPFSLFLTI